IIPRGATFAESGTLANTSYFPIWHEGLNGFPYVLKSRYWAPAGLGYNAYWLYLHLLFKINLIKSIDPHTIALSHRTPVSLDYETDTIELVDNSDEQCQVYHPLEI